MQRETFYRSNKKTVLLEYGIRDCSSFEDFEKRFPDEFLNEDSRIGDYLRELLYKHDKKASVVSFDAHLNHSYVGNIINGKKNNPSRDALICICLSLGADEEETQYLLKYGGHAPLYVRRKRDVIIWFGLKKGERIETVNDNLLERGLKPLYRE
ncbi:MAG: hypothetical protein IJG52_05120 [Lachnospiraceae bacterium]|nr:hypothetical protein [Lachnospiraceae bacterium]